MMVEASRTEAMLDVTAIVITRNEERNIVDVLTAVDRALKRAAEASLIRTYEVVLVDSASRDRTVELASRFAITIARLQPNWPLSASAGRAMGARLARGRFLLFVDGDYLLDEQWLLGAWPLMDDGRVAGVCGWDLEETTETSQLERLWASVDLSNVPDIQTVDSIASGLIRRSAYETTGGFHPFLKGGEDRDLGLRFIREGWRLLKTRRTMGIHRLADPGHRLTWIEYFRSVGVWSYGEGQACRARWFERPLRKVFLARYATMRYLIQDLQLVGLLTIALSVPAAVLVGGLFVLLGLVGASALAVFLISSGRRRRRSLRETLFDLHGAVYGPYRQGLFAIGLLRSPPPASSYPGEVEIVHSPRAHQ